MKKKKWTEMSEDEIQYKEMLRDQWHIRPSRKAVQILTDRINEVLKKLGVDITKDDESVKTQMDILGIFISSLGEEQSPQASGLYITAMINGSLQPYAYISSAKVNSSGYYWFPITYWMEERLDDGHKERLIH